MMRRLVIRGLVLLLVTVSAMWPAADRAFADASCAGAFIPVAADTTIMPAKEDLNAGYYVGLLRNPGNASFVVRGEFPHSAFVTWVVYGADAQIYNAIADKQITPDPGSRNPFLPGVPVLAQERKYTLFFAQPGSPIPAGIPQSNIVRLPPATGNPHLYLIMRTYWPQPGHSRYGGPLPTVTAVSAAAPDTSTSCPSIDLSIPAFPAIRPPRPQPGRILFFRPPYALIPALDGTERATPTGCAEYGVARVDPYRPNLIKVHKLPVFPDNQHYTSTSVWSDDFDVRYVDLQAQSALLLGRGSNVAMNEIRRQPDGSAYFLAMSPLGPLDPVSRSLLLSKARAKNWNVMDSGLDGPLNDAFVVYRNKLTTPGFAGSLRNVPCFGPDRGAWNTAPALYASGPGNMGPYYLDGASCSVLDVLSDACARRIG